MATAFQLRMKLHTPVVLPTAAPRLDILLAEAVRRERLDWSSPVDDIPLVWDEKQGGYRGSQVVFGTTVSHGLIAQEIKFPSSVTRLPLADTSSPKKSIKLDGGSAAPKLTHHKGYLSPYLLFYGEGDPDRCVALLSLLHHIGKEHARGQGHVSLESVVQDSSEGWRRRAWRQPADHGVQDYTSIPDRLRMGLTGEDEPVLRPPRVLKELVS